VNSAGRALLKRDALLLATLVFDLWAADTAYGMRRCRRRAGEPRIRDAVVVCHGHKSLVDAGWLGRIVVALRRS
jgi:hypothetical protein